jgi:hypothetical protein
MPALKRLRQEFEFETCLGYVGRPYPISKKKIRGGWKYSVLVS